MSYFSAAVTKTPGGEKAIYKKKNLFGFIVPGGESMMVRKAWKQVPGAGN